MFHVFDRFVDSEILPLFHFIFRNAGAFVFGSILTILFTEVMKLSAGRLRPHFLSVCNVNFTQVDCSKNYGYVVIDDAEDCMGEMSAHTLIDAR